MVGDCNHYFNKKLVSKLKDFNDDLVIDFFSFTQKSETYYPYNKIAYNFTHSSLKFLKIDFSKIFLIYNLIKFLKKNKYDIIHFQSSQLWVAIMSLFFKFNSKLIISIWGSDFYRQSKLKQFLFQKRFYKKADIITFTSSKTLNDFRNHFNIKKNFKIVRFGLDLLDVIEKERSLIKKDKNKINITIGYNSHPAQQHIRVLKSIARINKNLKSKINLILPFTYGPEDEDYISEIKNICFKNNLKVIFVNKHLSEIELARLRLSSHLMIQTQISDQFSGSMQEYLYAENIIIVGEWLEYPDLENSGINLIKIKSFDEINHLLTSILKNPEKFKDHSAITKIKDISGWNKNLPLWNGLYY